MSEWATRPMPQGMRQRAFFEPPYRRQWEPYQLCTQRELEAMRAFKRRLDRECGPAVPTP
jgi:hypothetical protein